MTRKKKRIIIISSVAASVVVLAVAVVLIIYFYRHPASFRDLNNESLGEAQVLELRDEIAARPDKKMLVAYFSYSGNTKRVAEEIASETGANLYEINVASPYTDLYGQSNSEIRRGDRPALADTVQDIEQYDVVFVGYPIWWHATPAPINTFLEINNLKGKLVIPFCTSQECPIEETMPTFLDSCKDLAVYGSRRIVSLSEVTEWLVSLELGFDNVK